MQQVLVIHGGGPFFGIDRANLIQTLSERPVDLSRLQRRDDWKAELQTNLGDVYEVLSPRMPYPDDPRYDEWKAWFERILSVTDDSLIVVGHSMGGLFLLNYFSENDIRQNVRGIFAVAAPFVGESIKWQHTGFATKDFSKLKDIKNIFLYHSTDDPTVPYADFEKYLAAIPHATAKTLEARGHFLSEDFPEIVADIKNLA